MLKNYIPWALSCIHSLLQHTSKLMHWHCTECNHQGRLERTQVYPGGGTIGVDSGVSLHPSCRPRKHRQNVNCWQCQMKTIKYGIFNSNLLSVVKSKVIYSPLHICVRTVYMTLVISTHDEITHPSSNYHTMWLNFSDLMGTGVSHIVTPHISMAEGIGYCNTIWQVNE